MKLGAPSLAKAAAARGDTRATISGLTNKGLTTEAVPVPTSQSRPSPARSGKVMESAEPNIKTNAERAGASGRKESRVVSSGDSTLRFATHDYGSWNCRTYDSKKSSRKMACRPAASCGMREARAGRTPGTNFGSGSSTSRAQEVAASKCWMAPMETPVQFRPAATNLSAMELHPGVFISVAAQCRIAGSNPAALTILPPRQRPDRQAVEVPPDKLGSEGALAADVMTYAMPPRDALRASDSRERTGTNLSACGYSRSDKHPSVSSVPRDEMKRGAGVSPAALTIYASEVTAEAGVTPLGQGNQCETGAVACRVTPGRRPISPPVSSLTQLKSQTRASEGRRGTWECRTHAAGGDQFGSGLPVAHQLALRGRHQSAVVLDGGQAQQIQRCETVGALRCRAHRPAVILSSAWRGVPPMVARSASTAQPRSPSSRGAGQLIGRYADAGSNPAALTILAPGSREGANHVRPCKMPGCHPFPPGACRCRIPPNRSNCP